MKTFLVLLCSVSQLVLPIWMWNFPNCYDISVENDQACCRYQVRKLYKIKDDRFVDCLMSRGELNGESMCEESFSKNVAQIIEEECTKTEEELEPDDQIVFRKSISPKCIQKKGRCQRMNWNG